MNTTIPHRPWPMLGLLLGLATGTLLAPGAPAAAGAELGAPLESRNLAPALASLGVPTMEDGTVLEPGEWRASWGLHWASHSLRTSGDGRTLEYDGETQRQDLRLSAGIGHRLSLSLNLPWISHNGGVLDPVIDGWHGLWGMPDGARDDQDRDRLRFALSGAGGFLVDDRVSGIGDVEIALALALWSGSGGGSLAGFAQYKLDTGEPDDLTGSGDDALAVGLRLSNPVCFLEKLSCHGQVGVVHIGEPAFAPDTRQQLLFAGLSLAWNLSPSLALVGQVEVQEQAFRRGPLEAVGTPVLGTLGLRWIPGSQWMVEGQFSEDLNVGSAPDVSFRVSLARRW